MNDQRKDNQHTPTHS